MRKVVIYKNSILSWFFSKVLDNTIWTIFIGGLIGGAIPLLITFIDKINTTYLEVSLLILSVSVLIYTALAYEKMLYESDFVNRRTDWKSNELRPLGVVANIEDALFLQFFDIPYTLNKRFDGNYAFEFKAKILTDVFSWTISSEISKSNIQAYMFQYSPFNQTLRPHLLMGYDSGNNASQWITPEMINSPLRSKTGLKLEERNGWFYVRTEVRRRILARHAVEGNGEQEVSITLSDGSISKIRYNPENLNKMLDIRIYDMNNYGQEVYHVVYTEPPFVFLGGEYIGFRNCHVESALYKDVKVYEIAND